MIVPQASAAKQDALELVKKLQRKHSNLLKLGAVSAQQARKSVVLPVPVFSRMGGVTPRQRKLMLAMTSKRLDVDASMEGSPATGQTKKHYGHPKSVRWAALLQERWLVCCRP